MPMPREVILNKKLRILPEGCAVINDTMVVADLHLGYEGVLATSGLFMPRVSLRDVVEKIERVLRRHEGLRTLVVNGDLKHEFSELHKFEWKDVDGFVKYAIEKFENLIVVRGNHDNYLKILLKKYGLELHESYSTNGFLFIHGDKASLDIFSQKNVILGHEHPAMVVKDSVNVKAKVPCFLYGKINRSNVLVLPAFSPIFPGSDIISLPQSALLSPILRKHGIDSMKVYACLESEILEFPEIGVIKRHV